MGVVLLLALVWAIVLVPPAVRAHAERKQAFLVSFGDRPEPQLAAGARSQPVQRRRRIAGSLLVAMAVTLVAGLLPPFRGLLVVHLFLVDSFLAYIGLLAHAANRAARQRHPVPRVVPIEAPPEVAPATRARRRRGESRSGLAVLPELGTIAPLG